MAIPRGFSPLRSSTPATFVAIGLLAVAFLLSWLPSSGAFLGENVTLQVPGFQPWQLLTYPLFTGMFGGALLCFLFGMMWLFMIGKTLEPSIGSRAMTVLLLLMTLVGGLFFWVGAALSGVESMLFAPFLPISYLTVLWAAKYPEQTILFMMFIPLKAKYLALLTAAIVLFGYGAGMPLLGVILVIPMAVIWFYAASRIGALQSIPGVSAKATQKKRDDREFRGYIDKVREKEQERAERERLRKLFEDSVNEPEKD